MGTITTKYENGDKLGPQFKASVTRHSERHILAVQSAARRAAEEIETLGRSNIRSGGNFSSARWIEGFQARVSFLSRADLVIRVTHAVRYWKVFEEGRIIRGRPLLWIPLGFSEAGRLGVRARDFPGKLFRVNRPGKAPLLMNEDGPQYFGKESVRIPRKWHLRDIVKRVARNLKQYYREAARRG